MPRESADMHLVDDRLGKRPAERGIALPVIGVGVDDDALQRCRRVVSRFSRRLPAPPHRSGDAFAVRIEEHLVRVAT